MKIIVNAITTKKRTGGAFQVALNFIRQSILTKQGIEWFYFLSKDVYDEVERFIERIDNVFVFPTQPDFRHTYLKVRKELIHLEERLKPDVIYTITSPCYFTFKSKEVLRFTNPWVSHPNEYAWKTLSLNAKFNMSIYIFVQKLLIRKAKWFVTQTEQTQQGIMKVTKLPKSHVKVVSNVLPPIFNSLETSHTLDKHGNINIASVSASIPHKNLDIIPFVIYNLIHLYGIKNLRFHLTLPENGDVYQKVQLLASEMHLEDFLVNHGRCSQEELAQLYRRCDLAFLPTLLEVFSASSLEAMKFGLPIVTTDFDFNKEIISDAALYYKPMDAVDAASKIFEVLTNADVKEKLLAAAVNRLNSFDNYESHFSAIVDFLEYVVNS